MSWSTVVCAVSLGTALVLPGCSGDAPSRAAAEPSTTSSSIEMVRDVTQKARLAIDIAGAKQVDVDQQADVRFLRTTPTDDDPSTRVTSVTVPDPIRLPSGELLMPEVVLLGENSKDGEISLPAGPGVGAQATTGRVGHVLVTFVQPSPLSETRFAVLKEPCVVKIESGGARGSARCPALATENGQQVSFTMTWGA